MKNPLDNLRELTKVVIDTGDIDSIKKFSPLDATTNPSLIYQAVQKPQYQPLVQEAVAYAKSKGTSKKERYTLLIDKLFVNFGIEILKLIPGRVSTEVDARLSFNVQGTIDKAHTLIKLYESAGITRDRILIKLASTWEGALAARKLEEEGIHINMTLLFSLPQAVAAAEAKATLMSPFVGRILDWYKKHDGVESFPPDQDPGVKSVQQIYDYLKKFDYSTQIMGASFRNIGEIVELAGCDLLTISPQLLQELSQSEEKITRKLDATKAKQSNLDKINLDEKTFRWLLNENAMATEKLAEGIRGFTADTIKLEKLIQQNYQLE